MLLIKKNLINMKRKYFLFIATAIMSTILFVNCEKPVTKYESEPFDKSEPIEIEFALVEGGTYTMGSADAEYSVVLDPYYISKHEITQAQWEKVMGAKGDGLDNWNNVFGWGNNFPAYRVNFKDIQEFLKKLNDSQTEYFYSLPTEAEWEVAARGGQSTQNYTYSGGNDIDDVAWYKDNSEILYREGNFTAVCASHIVGKKAANELGLFDMSGNLSEICSDIAGAKYEAGNTYYNPKGALSGSAHIVRGGNFMSDSKICQVFDRTKTISETERNVFVGFRLVRKNFVAAVSLTLDNHEINLFSKEKQQLTASILPLNASVQNVTWSSSKAGVASVDEFGLVTAVSPNKIRFCPDTAMIYAVSTYRDVEVKDSCKVIVGVIDVDNVTLNETNLELYVGQETQLTATILPENADFKNIAWTNSNPNIVILDNNGKIKAYKIITGETAIITATTYNGLTATCEITVVPPVAVTGVQISPTSVSVAVGGTSQLTATVLPSDASNKKVFWSSDNTAIATVNDSGLVKGVTKGTTKVKVTTQDGSFEKTCNVTVQ